MYCSAAGSSELLAGGRFGVAYLVIALALGLSGGIVGKFKGSSFLLWFLICALLPGFGLLASFQSEANLRDNRLSTNPQPVGTMMNAVISYR